MPFRRLSLVGLLGRLLLLGGAFQHRENPARQLDVGHLALRLGCRGGLGRRRLRRHLLRACALAVKMFNPNAGNRLPAVAVIEAPQLAACISSDVVPPLASYIST